MEIADSYTLHASREQVWNALLDPATLKRSVPGCELLEQTGDNAYAMRLNVRVAGIKGVYHGTLQLLDVQKPEMCRMVIDGAGKPGILHSDTALRLEAEDADTTVVHYSGQAQIDGSFVGTSTGGAGKTADTLMRRYFDQLADLLPDRSVTIIAPEAAETPMAPPLPPSPATSTMETVQPSSDVAAVTSQAAAPQTSRRRPTSSRTRKPKDQQATEKQELQGERDLSPAMETSDDPPVQNPKKNSGHGTASSRRSGNTRQRSSTIKTAETAKIADAEVVQTVQDIATVHQEQTSETVDTANTRLSPSELSPASEVLPSIQDTDPPAYPDTLTSIGEHEVVEFDTPQTGRSEQTATVAESATSQGQIHLVVVDQSMPDSTDGYSERNAIHVIGLGIAIIAMVATALLVWFVIGGLH